MHDPFLKSFYSDRSTVEILIREHVPEWAGEIDYSTLREEPTALVSRKTLQQRHPDMIWSAGVADGERVLFLVEFQRKAERLMALRTTTYAALTLERAAAGADFRRRGRPLPEFVYLVLYHGDGPWSGPERVTDLFARSDPGRFRLVSWRGGGGAGRAPDDITAMVLGLARNHSPEDMAAQVAALGRRVAERGDARLKALVFERVRTMLELRDYAGKLNLGGASSMDEMAKRFQRGLDELVERGAREGRREGVREGVREGAREGRVMVLRRQIARRFGEETAGRVSGVLDGMPGPDAIDAVTDALFECGTGEEFVERMGTG